jgi:hypothetical protein
MSHIVKRIRYGCSSTALLTTQICVECDDEKTCAGKKILQGLHTANAGIHESVKTTTCPRLVQHNNHLWPGTLFPTDACIITPRLVSFRLLAPPKVLNELVDKLEISAEKADGAKHKYAKLHALLVQAMSKEKELLDEARSLNRKLQVSSRNKMCCTSLVSEILQRCALTFNRRMSGQQRQQTTAVA